MKYKFMFNIKKFRYMLITDIPNKKVGIYKRYLFFIWKKHYTFPLKELNQAVTYLRYLQNR